MDDVAWYRFSYGVTIIAILALGGYYLAGGMHGIAMSLVLWSLTMAVAVALMVAFVFIIVVVIAAFMVNKLLGIVSFAVAIFGFIQLARIIVAYGEWIFSHGDGVGLVVLATTLESLLASLSIATAKTER